MWSVTGLDVGQATDYAALVSLVPADRSGAWAAAAPVRLPLGTGYGQVVAAAAERVAQLARAGTAPVLAVDATGVGRPIVELAREATSAPVVAVTWTGGRRPRVRGPHDVTVPRAALVRAARQAVAGGALEASALVDPVRAEVGQGHDDLGAAVATAWAVVQLHTGGQETLRRWQVMARAATSGRRRR